MSEARVTVHSVWTAETQKLGVTCVLKLASLPPTTETFTEKSKRADLQISLEEYTSTCSSEAHEKLEYKLIIEN